MSADSLYRRFQEAKLSDVKMFLHLAVFARQRALDFVQATVMPHLDQTEAAEWHAERVQADAEGTFFFTYPTTAQLAQRYPRVSRLVY